MRRIAMCARCCALCLAAVVVAAAPARAANGLVAAYAFNEGTGTAIADASGTGNNGTVSGTTWSTAGKYGAALSFNGTSSSAAVPDSNSLDLSTGLTLEAWVNPTALNGGVGGWRTMVFKQTSGGMAYAVYANNDGARPAGHVNIGGEKKAIGTAQLPLNTWSHLATTYDGATQKLYVNGTQVASRAQTGAIPASTGPFRIGGNSIWGEWFAGLIDEVRVYNRALTAAEIGTDMTTAIGGTTTGGDTTSPTVQLTAPADGATVSGTVTATASASDDTGVAGVRFQLDGGNLAAEDTTAPYSASWDTTGAAGTHTLRAIARDAAGNTTTSAPVTVTVPSTTTPQFVNDKVIIGLDEPTTMTFTPDGRMLVAERDGTIWVVPAGGNQVLPTPFLQIPNVVNDNERGLLGLTLDPQFATNGYVYAYYTHSTLHNRVSRFTATGNQASPASEFVVWQNTADANVWHQGGDLQFGPDGYLYISVGDHLDSQSAQLLTSYNGKILRVDRDGVPPTTNPFYDGGGPNLDAIWARGLRNPFRFTIDAPTGRLIIGDVGESSWEEVNVGVAGANYGWPLCEGTCGTAGMTNPVHTYPHNGFDASITAGFVYRGTQFPDEYRGEFFYADYAQNWIKRLTLDAGGSLTATHNFEPPDGASNGPYGDIVDLTQGPDGSLWYVDAGPFENVNAGAVRRIRNTNANQPPTAVAAATPTTGAAPLAVSFSSSGSADPEGAPLTYRWDFGDGGTSTQANPSHTYAAGGYTARLTTSDGSLETASTAIAITAGTAPVPTIQAPTDGATFRGGNVITYSGRATDAEDGTLPSSSLSWKIVFHHDTHIHPVMDDTPGASGTLTIPTTGHSFKGNTNYELVLTATDSDGIQASRSVTIQPEKTTLTIATTPPGLTLNVDGVANTAPVVATELIGFQYTIDVPSPQSGYTFNSWSDGGARSHTITVPATDQTVTARFDAPPSGGLIAAYGFNEGSGTAVADLSGHNHPGTITGPTWSTAGHTGNALSFDGVNDYVNVPDQAELRLPTAMTLEAWVRPTQLSGGIAGWRTVVFKQSGAGMAYSVYANNDANRPAMHVNIGGEQKANGTTQLPLNAWSHLAGTYDGTTVRLFLNGVQVASKAQTGAIPSSTGPLRIGGNAVWGEWFAGLIDDVRVYNRALAPSEIQGDMARAAP